MLWTDSIRIYSTPESGQDGQLATYNSHAHPAWTGANGELLISYNVIALGENANPVPLSHYRPHFLRLRIGD